MAYLDGIGMGGDADVVATDLVTLEIMVKERGLTLNRPNAKSLA